MYMNIIFRQLKATKGLAGSVIFEDGMLAFTAS